MIACVYCGEKSRHGVCSDHSDLPALDPHKKVARSSPRVALAAVGNAPILIRRAGRD